MKNTYVKGKQTGNIYLYDEETQTGTAVYLGEENKESWEIGEHNHLVTSCVEPLSLKEDWFLLLPDGYRELALTAREKQMPQFLHYSSFAEKTAKSLDKALFYGFAWPSDERGASFWDNVYRCCQTMDFSNLPPLPSPNPVADADLTFPLRAQHVSGTFIVEFSSKNTGTVVESSGPWRVGDSHSDWLPCNDKEWKILTEDQSPIVEPETNQKNNKEMKQLPKNWYIKTLSPGICREIQEQLFKLGYQWQRHGKTVSFTDVGLLFNKTEYVIDGFQLEETFKTSTYFGGRVEISIEDLFNAAPLPPQVEKKIFKLATISHDIVVEGEKITVGCQTTTVADLKNLVEASNKRINEFNQQDRIDILEEDYSPCLYIDKKNVKVEFGDDIYSCSLDELEKLLNLITDNDPPF